MHDNTKDNTHKNILHTLAMKHRVPAIHKSSKEFPNNTDADMLLFRSLDGPVVGTEEDSAGPGGGVNSEDTPTAVV